MRSGSSPLDPHFRRSDEGMAQARKLMKSRLLHHIWHHTLPDLGVDARRRQAIRAWAHRLVGREHPQVRVLRQIRAIMDRSRDVLRQAGVPSGAPVIIWTMRGGPQVNATEAILAHALRLRGVDVRIVLCDKFLPACEQRAVHMYPGGRWNAGTDAQICDVCHFNATQVFDAFELPVTSLSTLVKPAEVAEIQRQTSSMSRQQILEMEVGGIQLGAEVRASLNLFYRSLRWPDSAQTTALLRKAAAAALMLRQAAERVLDQERPRAVVTSHGIYLLWGVITRVAGRRGIPLTVWGNGYRTNTLRFSQGNWFEVMRAEPNSAWSSLDLTPDRVKRLDEYLEHRWDGRRDRRTLFDHDGKTATDVWAALGLDPARPTLGMFPNVGWDADLTFKEVAFEDMSDWLVETVRFFLDKPDWQLIVRAHPGEALATTKERTDDVVHRAFPTLSRNIVVIPAESRVSSYALAAGLRAAAVYGSQIGLELACRGIPVLVSAGCFYEGKGFSIDVTSREQYRAQLARLDTIAPLDDAAVRRARTYAYHYYFRRLTPFPYLISRGWSALEEVALRRLEDLLPGRAPYLDAIVDGILNDTPITLDV